MKKIYVLDTNVLLTDPFAIYAFEKNDVVIPSVVLQEIDNKKRLMDGIGFNARTFSKELDRLRETGKLHKGVKLKSGGKLFVKAHPQTSDIYNNFLDDSPDTKIITVAHELKEENTRNKVILVSRDIMVRVKADACDINAEDYLFDKVITSDSDKYEGYRVIETDSETIDYFYREREMKSEILGIELLENEIVILKCGKQSALGIFKKNKIIPFFNYDDKGEVFGLKPRNVEQKMALELLLDDSIPLVTISSKAGTGKTILALAVGLHKTLDHSTYNKVSVARPNVQMGKEHGFLSGDLQEKLRPLTQPIYDNLEFLLDCKDQKDLENKMAGYEGIIDVQALSYIRGRSIPKQYILIDEAQNLTQHEVKTILTRVGEKSKIILVGDPEQIDHPYLDQYSNGLTYVIEKMKKYQISAHITLKQGERSELAEICANVL